MIESNVVPLLGLGLVWLLFLILLPGYLWEHRQSNLRRQLIQTIVQYRLSKMLSFLGIKLNDYVNHVPEQIVLKHISKCIACQATRECDRCLRDGRFVADLKFCPNYRSLMHCSRMMPAAKPN